jgi:hypothetical protein
MTRIRYTAAGLLILILAGCAQAPTNPTFVTTPVPETSGETQTDTANGYPPPSQAPDSGYPAPTVDPAASIDGRSETALDSYPLALAAAQEGLDAAVRLHAIVPSDIMIGNLGGPPVLPGWFYRFKIPGQRREFIVQVADGAIVGSTLAESIEDPRPAELPIDLDRVTLDSDDVLARFQEYAEQQNIETEGVIYDLELVYLEGSSAPVWSVVDPRTRTWLFSLDAVTGEEVPDPRQ